MRWSNVSRCFEMDMEQNIGRGRKLLNKALEKRNQRAASVKRLREEFKHVQDVRLNKVFWFVEQLGEDKCKALAEKNLSAFHFIQACNKELEK